MTKIKVGAMFKGYNFANLDGFRYLWDADVEATVGNIGKIIEIDANDNTFKVDFDFVTFWFPICKESEKYVIDAEPKEVECKFEVGQTVWDVRFGKGTVTAVRKAECGAYPVTVMFDCIAERYTADGKYDLTDVNATLYFSEPKIVAEVAETEPPWVRLFDANDTIVAMHRAIKYKTVVEVADETRNAVIGDRGSCFPKAEWDFYKLQKVE